MLHFHIAPCILLMSLIIGSESVNYHCPYPVRSYETIYECREAYIVSSCADSYHYESGLWIDGIPFSAKNERDTITVGNDPTRHSLSTYKPEIDGQRIPGIQNKYQTFDPNFTKQNHYTKVLQEVISCGRIKWRPSIVHSTDGSRKIQKRSLSYTETDYESLKKTVYGHANLEPKDAQMGVAFVIMNRAKANKDYWGGKSIDTVCRKPGEFWLGISGNPEIDDWDMYDSIDEWLPGVMKGETKDLTNGATHFLFHEETEHDWLKKVKHVATFGSFNFYKAKWIR